MGVNLVCWRKCAVFDMFCTILKWGCIVKFQCTEWFSEVFYKRKWTVDVSDLENCIKRSVAVAWAFMSTMEDAVTIKANLCRVEKHSDG
jgi:hypothetical protein